MNLGHSPDLNAARYRADSLRKVRKFFFERDILEVETPILSRGISLDCHIDVMSTEFHPLGFARPEAPSDSFFLQTSPEPHMKRLLCQGFPDIFQFSRAFRNGETGQVHNPEFTMLEWYRKGFSLHELIGEVQALCQWILGPIKVQHLNYADVFQEAMGLNPLDFDYSTLNSHPKLSNLIPLGHHFLNRADALDFVMAHLIEPSFPPEMVTFLSPFPSVQAAQAQISSKDSGFAYRFEVYGGGMELGNGYLELLDGDEYSRRFILENLKRNMAGKPTLPVDPLLANDLRKGLPPCAGVAMGFDRLLMLGMHARNIGSVLNFPWETC